MNTINKTSSMRIAKRIAASGLCSRREAEKYVLSEKVMINNKIVTSLAMLVNNNDKILVDGQIINSIPNSKLYVFNKPKGCIVSEKDPQNRKTIYDIISKNYGRLMYIGRLDYNSEGLLLLTNNGQLKRYFELPKNNIQRSYKVKVHGNIKNINKEKLKRGIVIDGISYGKIDLKIIEKNDKNSWLEIKMREGKNREIRNICKYFGLKVNDLIRTSFGPYNLENLNREEIKEISIKPNILKRVNFD